ncbi:MAG: peptidoglycan editing factor PgeF [Ruminococcaceae bacterium]|nr:peptidoglycan editing factor PgeF [Oscillospiraceae bacterium]
MERIISSNGVVYYRSELIPCPHGFSTRLGGVSTLEHTKFLNLGVERGDERETVLENLRLFAEAVGFSPKEVISVPQIHSSKVRYVTENNAGEGFYCESTESCDGYVTDRSGVVLGIRTADCVPILLYAPPHNSFGGAVAAVHAGWRGTASKIVINAVNKMIEKGAALQEIRAAIGPAIEKCCYKVRDDFYNDFKALAGEELSDKFVKSDTERDGVWWADIKGVNRELLIQAGIPGENIDVCNLCTCCMPHEFYSHRYTKGKRGTMLSVITLT